MILKGTFGLGFRGLWGLIEPLVRLREQFFRFIQPEAAQCPNPANTGLKLL